MRKSLRACALISLFVGPVSAVAARDLTFEERVAAQRAIEEVYWRHRIWPKENPAPRPPLEAVIPDELLRARVAGYLKKSNALADLWRRPITAEQLQAEMARMAVQTRDPAMLQELFDALGNDPFLIAETLARQTLADRLIRTWYARDERFHGEVRRQAERALAGVSDGRGLKALGARYSEKTWRLRSAGGSEYGPEERKRDEIVLDSAQWQEKLARLSAMIDPASATRLRGGSAEGRTTGSPELLPRMRISSLQEADGSFYVTSVIAASDDSVTTATGSWPKTGFDSWWTALSASVSVSLVSADGGFTPVGMVASSACDPDTWTDTAGGDESRSLHTAVWTGSEMIVWGGFNDSGILNTGRRYDPSTDSWVSTSVTAAPAGRVYHTAVWTGSEMIVWGGSAFNTGGRYDPSMDTWIATSITTTPAARSNHTAVWTGSEMIVWGGIGGSALDTGGRYDPSTDTWIATSITTTPAARSNHTAVWTGSEMIVWGGIGGSALDTGGRYDPSTDTWIATSITTTPAARSNHTALWTGNEMIVWGGSDLDTGGRYDPSTDTWVATSTIGAPAARSGPTAVWTGSEMLIWGGHENYGELNSGGRYSPSTDSWIATSTLTAPLGRWDHTAVWTGSEMIVWGGGVEDLLVLNSGGRYDPSTDSWVATSAAPEARFLHTAVWTGSEMIVWGGSDADHPLNSGGRYSPSTATWVATATTSAPAARSNHVAVWTGSEMIVWGGNGLSGGGRYNPSTDTWVTISTTNAPAASGPAVWTGSEVIVWGGGGGGGNSGGRFDPSTDTWIATSTANAPAARSHHTAVWTGSEMIVWGGSGLNSGGRYDPSTDSWVPTSVTSAPVGRAFHTAVWTGNEMIVWGGCVANCGSTPLDDGGRYDPSADSWISTSATTAPVPRIDQTAVWTGSEMVVWGGDSGVDGYDAVDTGGRYSPSTDSWVATSTTDAPAARLWHSAVWTGTEMIVWGGLASGASTVLDTGGHYRACSSNASVYRDADGDGFGDPADNAVECTAPTDYVANDGDCNDGNDDVYPGAPETCDGLRNDCDAAGWPAPADPDSDGVEDACDACLFDPLNDQDLDGLCGELDNCWSIPNPLADCDANAGTPDEQCDQDVDASGDPCDNCPQTFNPDQFDVDHDGVGNACETDLDNDGIDDAVDPDDDGDGIPEDDGDGVPDPCPHLGTSQCDDNCPLSSNPYQGDQDGDGQGTACDLDDGTVNGGGFPGDPGGFEFSATPAAHLFAWVPEQGALEYNVYSALLSELTGAYYGTCHRNGIVTTYTSIPETPPAGVGFTYLVTAVMPGGEGGLGYDSNETPRPNASPCP